MKDEVTEEDRKAMEEWLKHNKITICPPGERSDDDSISYSWGKKKKSKSPKKVDLSEE